MTIVPEPIVAEEVVAASQPARFVRLLKFLRFTALPWAILLACAYVLYMRFGSGMMSNGKSSFQKVAESIAS